MEKGGSGGADDRHGAEEKCRRGLYDSVLLITAAAAPRCQVKT